MFNSSGETVYQLYCDSAGSSTWGSNTVIYSLNLKTGHYKTVNIPDNLRYIKIRAYFSGNRYKYIDRVDLNSTGAINIFAYGG